MRQVRITSDDDDDDDRSFKEAGLPQVRRLNTWHFMAASFKLFKKKLAIF